MYIAGEESLDCMTAFGLIDMGGDRKTIVSSRTLMNGEKSMQKNKSWQQGLCTLSMMRGVRVWGDWGWMRTRVKKGDEKWKKN